MFNSPIVNLSKTFFAIGKNLKSIYKLSSGLITNVFLDENLTPVNDKMTSICRKLKHNNSISKPYTVNDTVHLISNENHWKFSIWNRPSVFFFQILSLTWEIMSMMMQMIWLINRTCQAFNIWSIVEYGFVFLIVIEYCISIL